MGEMLASRSYSQTICGVVFNGMICTLHKEHHACKAGMHFSTERMPAWWPRRWSLLPGITYGSDSIRWKWTKMPHRRAYATGTCSTETINRVRVEALRLRLLEGPPNRLGKLAGHVEGERVCDCCDRADEYNGFDSGPTLFTCPKHCPCHD